MRLRISDMLDELSAPDVEIRETETVSADRIQEIVMRRIHAENSQRRVRSRRFTAIALAAALTIILSFTALAAAYQNGFFRNVFGMGIAGQEAQTIETGDSLADGVSKTEHFPTIERVEVDEDQAEALVGQYVTAVGQSVTLQNYTFTVEDVLLDANGIGAITLHVENPEGHGLNKSGVYDGTLGEYPPFGCAIERESGNYGFMDDRAYLVSDSFTDTEAEYVYYVTPFDPLPLGEALTLKIYINGDDEAFSGSITIPASDKIPAHSFVGDSISASVSPIGLAFTYDFGVGEEKIASNIVLRYSDGASYVILGDDLVNMAVSSSDEERNTCWIAFNRLADVDRIDEIQITGHWHGADGTLCSFERTLKSADLLVLHGKLRDEKKADGKAR